MINKLMMEIFSDALMEKYYELDYEAKDCPPHKSFEYYNQWLQQAKNTSRQALQNGKWHGKVSDSKK